VRPGCLRSKSSCASGLLAFQEFQNELGYVTVVLFGSISVMLGPVVPLMRGKKMNMRPSGVLRMALVIASISRATVRRPSSWAAAPRERRVKPVKAVRSNEVRSDFIFACHAASRLTNR
jgi:hypothetical protein